MYTEKEIQLFCAIRQCFVTITFEIEAESGYGCAILVTSENETCSLKNQCGHFKAGKCYLLYNEKSLTGLYDQ